MDSKRSLEIIGLRVAWFVGEDTSGTRCGIATLGSVKIHGEEPAETNFFAKAKDICACGAMLCEANATERQAKFVAFRKDLAKSVRLLCDEYIKKLEMMRCSNAVKFSSVL